MTSGGALLSAIVLCILPVLEAYTCDEIFSKATTLDFSQSGAEINVKCRLNLKHIEPHVLAPYLDILRTTSLVACFYSVYDVSHHNEYFNQESHVIAICKPGAMCLNRLHNEAYERGCVDGPTNQHQAACTGDFCNNRTQTELDLVNNILSTLTKTTSSSGSTTSTVPMATTPVRQLYTDSMTCEDIFRKASVLDFSQSNAEIKAACRLNLQHIEPHILAPYLDILRTTSLVACFYSVYDVSHHNEYFNQESHVIAICKPGAMCFNEGHRDAYKRGCVAGHTNQHQSTCSTDFCNNRTQTEMDLIGNILSLITTTTIKTTPTSTTTPSTTTTSTTTPSPTTTSTTKPSPTTTSTTTPSQTTTSTTTPSPTTTSTTTPSPTTTSTTTTSQTTTSTTKPSSTTTKPSTTSPPITSNPLTTSTTIPSTNTTSPTPTTSTTTSPSTTSNPSTASTTIPSTTTSSPTTNTSTTTSPSTTTSTTVKPSTTPPSTTTSSPITSTTTSAPTNSTTKSSTSSKTTTSKPMTTTSKPMTTTTTSKPMTSTKPSVTTTASSSTICSNSPQHQCRSEGFCAVYHANTGACNKPIDGNSRDFFHSCALFCNRCQEYCQSFSVKPQTTAAPRNCHQCGDLASSSPCSTLQVYTAPSTPCPAGLDFCMTDIHHDTSGNDHIYKRCVNRQTCETDWLAQTSDQDHCTRFGQVLTSGEFSCHFCCRGDGCNTRLVPDHSTFYTKT
nr:mucin-5AC isoform X1 [Crassostrea gigas]